MLKRAVITAAVLAFSATAAQAQDVSGYLQGSLGYAKSKEPDIFKDEGLKFTDKSDLAYKMIVGIRLNSYFALEAQYTDLGEAKLEVPKRISSKFENKGFGANVVGMLPVQDTGLTMFAKAGYHSMKTKAKLSVSPSSPIFSGLNISGSTTKNIKSFGAGAIYDVTPELSLVAEYEQYRKLAKISGYNIHVGSVGLRYNF